MKKTKEEFNTNNAWGFGGGIGIQTTYENGYYMRKGTAYYRHANPEKFTTYFDPDGRRITKQAFEEATK